MKHLMQNYYNYVKILSRHKMYMKIIDLLIYIFVKLSYIILYWMIRLITPNNLKEVNFANVSCFADVVSCNSTWYISHDLNILYGERRTTKENKQRLPVRIFFLRFQTLEIRVLYPFYFAQLFVKSSIQKTRVWLDGDIIFWVYR